MGIHISADKNFLVKRNFDIKLNKVDKILQAWRSKHLSIYGKVTVMNSSIVLQFTYCLLLLPSPDVTFFLSIRYCSQEKLWRITQDSICRLCTDDEEDICLGYFPVASFWQQKED